MGNYILDFGLLGIMLEMEEQMDANQAGKKIRAYFGAITERGMEPREIMIDMEDFLKWEERLGCLEKDMDGMIERQLAGTGHMTYRVLLSGAGDVGLPRAA